MLDRPLWLGSAIGALGALVAATASAATPDGTLRGSVAPALRPSPGTVTVARAIDASNLTVAGARAVTRAGGYSLKAPPGVYLVAVDKVGARTTPATGFARLVRLRSGRTASPPIVTRRPQTRAESRLYQGKPAVAVKAFQSSAQYPLAGRGVADLLTSSLSASPCMVVVEWLRRAEVIAEIRRQQDRRFDPSTAVRPGRLIQPDIFVEGSVAVTPPTATITARLRDARTGRVVGSASASGPDFFGLVDQIEKQLRDALEGECIPPRFEGTFTGENRVAGTNRYSGTIVFVRNTTSPPGIVTYRVERVRWQHSFTSETPCVVDASTNVSLSKPDPRLSVLVIDRSKTARGYGYAITAMFTSPRRLTLSATCNGVATTLPWVPGAALNTGPPGNPLAPGAGNYTDGTTIKGRYESTGTASTYTWDLRAAGL